MKSFQPISEMFSPNEIIVLNRSLTFIQKEKIFYTTGFADHKMHRIFTPESAIGTRKQAATWAFYATLYSKAAFAMYKKAEFKSRSFATEDAGLSTCFWITNTNLPCSS